MVFQYIVPVGVAYNGTQPYVEKNYSMPTFEQCKVLVWSLSNFRSIVSQKISMGRRHRVISWLMRHNRSRHHLRVQEHLVHQLKLVEQQH